MCVRVRACVPKFKNEICIRDLWKEQEHQTVTFELDNSYHSLFWFKSDKRIFRSPKDNMTTKPGEPVASI